MGYVPGIGTGLQYIITLSPPRKAIIPILQKMKLRLNVK